MDYVQTVLTRQQRLLSLLLLGGEREAAENAASAGDVRTWTAGAGTNTASAVSGAVALRAGDVLPAQGTQVSNRYPAAWGAVGFPVGRAGGVSGTADFAGSTVPGRTVPGGQTPVWEEAVSGGGTLAGESRAVSYVLPGGAVIPSGTGMGVRAVAAASAGAAASARELSRAFERDARRYDGGFSLY